MGAVDLDEVEARLLRDPGRERVVVDERVDLLARQLVRDRRPRGERHRRRRDRLAEQRLPARVPELDPDGDPVRPQRVDELPQAGDVLLAVEPQLGADAVRVGRDEARLDRDHPDPALGAAPVVRDRRVVAGAVVLRQARAHRRHHDPVREVQPGDVERLGQPCERRRRAHATSICQTTVRWKSRARPPACGHSRGG